MIAVPAQCVSRGRARRHLGRTECGAVQIIVVLAVVEVGLEAMANDEAIDVAPNFYPA